MVRENTAINTPTLKEFEKENCRFCNAKYETPDKLVTEVDEPSPASMCRVCVVRDHVLRDVPGYVGPSINKRAESEDPLPEEEWAEWMADSQK